MRSYVVVRKFEIESAENRTRDLNSGNIFPIGTEVGESEGNVRPILACNEVLCRGVPFLVEQANGVDLTVSSRAKGESGSTRDIIACAVILECRKVLGTSEKK